MRERVARPRRQRGVRWKPAVLVASALLTVGCGDDEPSTATSTEPSTTEPAPASTTTGGSGAERVDESTTVGFAGYGPIEEGMTLAEAREIADLVVDQAEFDGFGGHCFHARVAGMEDAVVLMVLPPDPAVPVDTPEEGRIARATIEDATTTDPTTTDRGIGLGDTADDVRAAYDDIEIAESPHHYVEGGRYLDLVDPADDGRMLRFETDAEGAVTAVHGGSADAVPLVEGCA